MISDFWEIRAFPIRISSLIFFFCHNNFPFILTRNLSTNYSNSRRFFFYNIVYSLNCITKTQSWTFFFSIIPDTDILEKIVVYEVLHRLHCDTSCTHSGRKNFYTLRSSSTAEDSSRPCTTTCTRTEHSPGCLPSSAGRGSTPWYPAEAPPNSAARHRSFSPPLETPLMIRRTEGFEDEVIVIKMRVFLIRGENEMALRTWYSCVALQARISTFRKWLFGRDILGIALIY